MFSVTIFNMEVFKSTVISILNPGLSLILISDFLAPISNCSSLSKSLISSFAWSKVSSFG